MSASCFLRDRGVGQNALLEGCIFGSGFQSRNAEAFGSVLGAGRRLLSVEVEGLEKRVRVTS